MYFCFCVLKVMSPEEFILCLFEHYACDLIFVKFLFLFLLAF